MRPASTAAAFILVSEIFPGGVRSVHEGRTGLGGQGFGWAVIYRINYTAQPVHVRPTQSAWDAAAVVVFPP